MPNYIVCHKKRNNPRMDVRICESKCPLKTECGEYKACSKKDMSEKPAASSTDADSIATLEAA